VDAPGAGRVRRVLIAAALAAALVGAVPAAATLPEFAGGQVPSLAPLLREITPAVVNIAVRGRVKEENPLLQDPFFRRFFNLPRQAERQFEATGSGVIVDARGGYVLTNDHVVENASAIEVTTKDNRRFRARLVGHDPETDVAVLQVDGANGLKSVSFGDSDRLEVGDFVLAIGNPFGLGQTVTSGIVSALGRTGLGIEGYEDFIQTDASINPGNSGGALVDLQGRLVGINTAILAPGGGNIGIGFAVPVNMARAVFDQILRYGEVRRGAVGVAIQDLTPEIAQGLHTQRSDGAVIAQVETGSQAERAGLRSGDIVVAANGSPIRSAAQLRNRIGLTPIGQRIELGVERGGALQEISVPIERTRPANARSERQRRRAPELR
jgi:Do/DeqQ family serine protease